MGELSTVGLMEKSPPKEKSTSEVSLGHLIPWSSSAVNGSLLDARLGTPVGTEPELRMDTCVRSFSTVISSVALGIRHPRYIFYFFSSTSLDQPLLLLGQLVRRSGRAP